MDAAAMLDPGDKEDLDDLCEEMDELKADIDRGVRQCGKLNGDAKAEKIRYVEDRVERVRVVYESYQLELRSHGKSAAVKSYRAKAREYKAAINGMIQELNGLKMGGAAALATETEEQIMIQHADKFSTGQLLHKGIQIQQQDIMSLQRQLVMIEESKQIAVDTIAELARQEEQLLRIAEDVTTVRENLKHAGKQLRTIARRLAGDNLIRCCCVLVFLALIGVVCVIAFVDNPPKTIADEIGPAPSSGSSGTSSQAASGTTKQWLGGTSLSATTATASTHVVSTAVSLSSTPITCIIGMCVMMMVVM